MENPKGKAARKDLGKNTEKAKRIDLLGLCLGKDMVKGCVQIGA